VVTDEQIRLYQKHRVKGRSQEASAAAAAMSPKTARKWEDLGLPSASDRPRNWRTRPDPLAGVWETYLVPLLEEDKKGELQATTLLESLRVTYPDKYAKRDDLLRTLQRRMRSWRASYGPAREVFFEQEHPPGRESQFDFTDCTELMVTIQGEAFEHLFFELVLSFSGRRFVQLCHGETFEATVLGIQDGFESFGGMTAVLRSDNLSAATQELQNEGGRTLTKRFRAFIDHLGIAYTRIEPGKSNQNGVVERAHQTFKKALAQGLLVRGSHNFASVGHYLEFANSVCSRLNERVEDKYLEELAVLKPLPSTRLPTYSDVEVMVRRWSTIRVRNNTYSVPSRLIGRYVTARVHPDTVEVIVNDKPVETFPRLRGRGHHRIDYRHIIHSLVIKPGAFARWRYREEMFPTLVFRQTYDELVATRGSRADVEYLRLLHLAANNNEATVEEILKRLLSNKAAIDYAQIRPMVEMDPPPAPPLVHADCPDLNDFDTLLTGEFRDHLTGSESTVAH
jgi:hypothetical protein